MPDDTTLQAWKESQRREFNLRSRKQFVRFTPSAWDKKKMRIADEEAEAEVDQQENEEEQQENEEEQPEIEEEQPEIEEEELEFEEEREVLKTPAPKKRLKKLAQKRKKGRK